MKILCKIFGHNFEPQTNSIGTVYKYFICYFRKMVCIRCGAYYQNNLIEPKE